MASVENDSISRPPEEVQNESDGSPEPYDEGDERQDRPASCQTLLKKIEEFVEGCNGEYKITEEDRNKLVTDDDVIILMT